MPKNSRRNSKGSRGGRSSGRRQGTKGPPVGATTYNGPAKIVAGPKDTDMRVVRLSSVTPLIAPATGTFVAVYTNNPNVSTEWFNFVNTYEEARVLATRVMFIPSKLNFTINTDTNFYAPCVWTVDRVAGVSGASTIALAFQKSNAAAKSIQQRHTTVVKAGSAQEMLFQAAATIAPTWQTSFVMDTYSPSAGYGVVFVEYVVQMRNRA